MSDSKKEKRSISKKAIILLIAAVIITAGVVCGVFAFRSANSKNDQPDIASIGSKVSVKNIRFKETSVTIKTGEKLNLNKLVESFDCADEDIVYISVDTSVANADENGILTAFAVGDTVVTAKLKRDDTVTAVLKVSVTVSSDTETQTDTSINNTDKEESTESDVRSKIASSSASSRSDTEKKTVSSAASKAENTSSNVTSSNTVTSQPDNNNYDNTVIEQPDNNDNNNDVNSTEENTNDNTEEYAPEDTESNIDTDQNNTYEYIDPYSVGKVYPISYVETDEKKVGISFDASWGNENTQSILDTLESYNITSTFFLVGIWVRAYPDDVARIAQAGHDIGNHSNTHPDLTQLDSCSIRNEMEICSAEIEALTGKRPTLFRNPYGAYDDRVIGTALGMGMDCIQWDVDTLDWTNNSGEEICARIRSRIRNGSIILMHNAGGNTASSLPMIIDTIHELGYEIVPISELIPKDGYTTDITGKLTPLAPREDELQSSAVSSAVKKIRKK